MSGILKDSLKSRLLNLECHFTWELLKEDCDVDDIEERLNDQIAFLPSTQRQKSYNMLAYIKYLNGENEEAIAKLKKAVENVKEIEPDETDIKWSVTYANYAWIYYHTNQTVKLCHYVKKVETIFQKIESSSSRNVLLTEIRGEQAWSLLTFCKKYYDRAKECFEKALELDPDNPELNSGYATVVYRLEGYCGQNMQPDEWKSVDLLKHAMKLNPDDTVIKALLALKYQDLYRAEEGKILIKEALAQTPDLPYLLRYAAKFYRNEKMTEESLKILKKALNLTPTSSTLHHLIGACYRQMLTTLKKAAYSARLNRQPTRNHTRQKCDIIHFAIFHFERAVELRKSFVSAHLALADMYARGDQHQKAEETFQKAMNIETITCKDKQEIHLKLGNYKEYHVTSEYEAIRHYKEAIMIPISSVYKEYAIRDLTKLAEKIRLQQSQATGLALLGFIHHQDGDTVQAINYYEQALKFDPNNKEYLSALCEMQMKI